MSYDSTADTVKHIQQVQYLLQLVIEELLTRSRKHDKTKLESPEKEVFDEFTPKLKDSTYMSEEYKQFLKGMKPALDHHYAENKHHPEHTFCNEEWREFGDGLHFISNKGRVKRIEYEAKREKMGKFIKPEIIKKAHVTPKGYARLQVSGKNVFVHTLVANVFLEPKPSPEHQINHMDGDKLNNWVMNLEWVTPSENLQHAYDKGLRESNVKYAVLCKELDITTFGTDKMKIKLDELGYSKISSAGIWGSLNSEGHYKHQGLTFISCNINEYKEMNSMLSGMNLMDLVEMMADWKSAADRHANGDIFESLKKNIERFNIFPQLASILRNTAIFFSTHG